MLPRLYILTLPLIKKRVSSAPFSLATNSLSILTALCISSLAYLRTQLALLCACFYKTYYSVLLSLIQHLIAIEITGLAHNDRLYIVAVNDTFGVALINLICPKKALILAMWMININTTANRCACFGCFKQHASKWWISFSSLIFRPIILIKFPWDCQTIFCKTILYL